MPPHDLDAERAALGAALLSATALDQVVEAIGDSAPFYRPAHAHTWAAMRSLASRGEPVDPLIVAGELRASGLLDAVGGAAVLVELQAEAPGTANAHHYAATVVRHARHRRLIDAVSRAAEAAWAGPSDVLDEALTQLDQARSEDAGELASRLHPGGTFVLDAPADPPALWGRGHEVLWAKGEPLLIVGPAGVGKSTLAGQVVRGRLGRSSELLGFPLVAGHGRVLYLAMDRPAQIQRSLARQFTADERPLLDQRLVVWKGPPPKDLARHPETLVRMARSAGADTVVLDSLKDAAVGLSDDEVGAGLNRAVQECVATGVEVLGLHHQRKGQGGEKPKNLEGVYGSTWITAGAGSVVLLWGAAGDPLVELLHLKQPAEAIGPLRIEHHAPAGTVSVFHSFDPLAFLRARGQDGATATEAAKAMFEKSKPTDTERKRAQRQLERLVRDGLADKNSAALGGAGGSEGARYRISVDQLREPQ